TLVLFDHRALESTLIVQLLAIQLGRCEAEPGYAIDLGKECGQRTFHPAACDQGIEARDLGGADEQSPSGLCSEKRRVGRLGDLVESRRQHPAEQTLDHV